MTNTEKSAMMMGIATGTLIVCIIGAPIALLYAPKSGRNLRSDFKQKSSTFLNDAELAIEHAKQNVPKTMRKRKADIAAKEANVKGAFRIGPNTYKRKWQG